MRKATSGFTIVELLIVIVVIAILATISVVAYNGIQDRATASVVKSDLANFAKKIELAKIDSGGGLYPTVLTPDMGIKVTKSAYITNRWNWYYCLSPDHRSYSLGVVDVKGRGYFQTPTDGISENVGVVGLTSNCANAGVTDMSTATYLEGLYGASSPYTSPPYVWQDWTN